MWKRITLKMCKCFNSECILACGDSRFSPGNSHSQSISLCVNLDID